MGENGDIVGEEALSQFLKIQGRSAWLDQSSRCFGDPVALALKP